MVRIYTLNDPTTDEVRYVGKTVLKLHDRLRSHLTDKYPCHKTNWIASLSSPPTIKLLEICDAANWDERERFWIAFFRGIGARLTNISNGGDGPQKFTPEMRQKISLAFKGKKRPCSPQRALAISRAKKGIPQPWLRGRRRPEVGLKISAILKGRPSKLRGVRQSGELVAKRVSSRIKNGNYAASEATRRRISQNHGQSRPVICVNTGTVYPSAYAASRSINKSAESVRNAIRGGWKCGGLQWAWKKTG